MSDEAAPPAAADRAAFPLVTLAAAAVELGRPKEALRAMIRRGKLRAVRGNDGQFLIELTPELREPRSQPRRGRAADHEEAAVDAAAEEKGAAASREAELEDAVEEWRLAAEEARLAAAVAAAKLEAAERIITDLERQRDRLTSELQVMLADVRRTWWRRLVG